MSKRMKLFPVQILAIGFGLIILVGGLLLSLPLSSKSGEGIPFINGLFTAASATCVTGLSVYDIFTQFNFFGQLMMILLIQIGGLGFMGIAMTFSFLAGSKITIFQRSLLMESIGTLHIGGVVKIIRRMLFGTLIFEGLGAIILSIRFIPMVGLWQGIWYGIFHSISAFCNAGFDLFGRFSPGSSVILFSDDPVVEITFMVLLVMGGIGFIVWSDILDHGWHFKKYLLHSKIMLTFSAALIFLGAMAFYVIEQDYTFAGMPTGERVLNAFFCAISPRTAGFASVNYADMSTAGRFITMLLMFIGAGPGSAGGGIKVTTFITLLLSMYSMAKHYNDLSIFKRRLEADAQKKALSSISAYMGLVLLCTFCLVLVEPTFTAESCLFESLSAMGTVGLTMGITPQLGVFAKGCLIFLMYCGRLGSIAVGMAIVRRKVIPKISYPEEKITLG